MERYQKFLPALIVPSPALIVRLPINSFPNKLAPKVPFCSFASFLVVSLTPFTNKPEAFTKL